MNIKHKQDINNKQIAKILKNNIIKESLKRLFTLNTLSQLLDETNSLSEISHKRKISCLGEGGISIKKANLKIREIHPSQYGKICPIETTEQFTLANKRLVICEKCPSMVESVVFKFKCKECGCPIVKKIYTPKLGTCDLHKWDKVEGL